MILLFILLVCSLCESNVEYVVDPQKGTDDADCYKSGKACRTLLHLSTIVNAQFPDKNTHITILADSSYSLTGDVAFQLNNDRNLTLTGAVRSQPKTGKLTMLMNASVSLSLQSSQSTMSHFKVIDFGVTSESAYLINLGSATGIFYQTDITIHSGTTLAAYSMSYGNLEVNYQSEHGFIEIDIQLFHTVTFTGNYDIPAQLFNDRTPYTLFDQCEFDGFMTSFSNQAVLLNHPVFYGSYDFLPEFRSVILIDYDANVVMNNAVINYIKLPQTFARTLINVKGTLTLQVATITQNIADVLMDISFGGSLIADHLTIQNNNFDLQMISVGYTSTLDISIGKFDNNPKGFLFTTHDAKSFRCKDCSFSDLKVNDYFLDCHPTSVTNQTMDLKFPGFKVDGVLPDLLCKPTDRCEVNGESCDAFEKSHGGGGGGSGGGGKMPTWEIIVIAVCGALFCCFLVCASACCLVVVFGAIALFLGSSGGVCCCLLRSGKGGYTAINDGGGDPYGDLD